MFNDLNNFLNIYKYGYSFGFMIKNKINKSNVIKAMEKIAKSISKKNKGLIDYESDKDYEEMLEERWKKASK